MGTGTILNGHFYQQMASFRSFVLALQTNLSYNFYQSQELGWSYFSAYTTNNKVGTS